MSLICETLVNVYFVAEEGIHQHQGEAQVANTMT
jgi:hypothetical protein